jgi:hypothetical protein
MPGISQENIPAHEQHMKVSGTKLVTCQEKSKV